MPKLETIAVQVGIVVIGVCLAGLVLSYFDNSDIEILQKMQRGFDAG
jgi:hypothetical protein